jgi:hypothetical protein
MDSSDEDVVMLTVANNYDVRKETLFASHTASCTVGTGGRFPGGKARPGRDADHSPPSSAEVVNE